MIFNDAIEYLSNGSVQDWYASYPQVIIHPIGQTLLFVAGEDNNTGRHIYLKHIIMNMRKKRYTVIYMLIQ